MPDARPVVAASIPPQPTPSPMPGGHWRIIATGFTSEGQCGYHGQKLVDRLKGLNPGKTYKWACQWDGSTWVLWLWETGTPPSEETTVTITKSQLSPASITVAPGISVFIVLNNDTLPHHVLIQRPGANALADSGQINQGDLTAFSADLTAGTYTFVSDASSQAVLRGTISVA